MTDAVYEFVRALVREVEQELEQKEKNSQVVASHSTLKGVLSSNETPAT